MKRGAKRPALFADAPDATDSILRSKRVMDAPSFDVHRAESSSRQHLMAGAPLDAQRAESSRQHVRALNTQFVSWIQLQLQNHPDELWEDGVKDYLSHASNIMEKFKDVVEWLRANAAKAGSITTSSSPSGQNNLLDIPEKNQPRMFPEISNGFAREGPSASSLSAQNSGLSASQSSGFFPTSHMAGFSGNQMPMFPGSLSTSVSPGDRNNLVDVPEKSQPRMFPEISNGFARERSSASSSSLQSSGLSASQSSGFFSSNYMAGIPGNQMPMLPGSFTSTAPKVEASGDVDEENELEQPSSPSLKKTEEKGVVVVHEAKCKVYVKADNTADKGWKDIGMGQLSIKCKEGISKATKESRPTIVIRNDVGKILLNALLYPGIKMNIQKNTIASIFHTLGGVQTDGVAVARMYLLRLKSEEETTKLATAIKEYAPST